VPVNLWLLMKMIASQLLLRFVLLALVNGIITMCEISGDTFLDVHPFTYLYILNCRLYDCATLSCEIWYLQTLLI